MYVAVGRVQVTVTVDDRTGVAHANSRGLDRQTSPRRTAVEKAYARAQLQRAVEADRARWERTIQLSGRGHL
jgi:uncharacterized protein GlcG (DUF336 family)